jgi:FkbH-like protein
MRLTELRRNLKKDYSRFPRVKLAVVGDTPTQFLAEALRACAYDLRLDPEIFEAGVGQITAQVLDVTSELYQFEPDYVLIFEATRAVRSRFYMVPRESQRSFASAHLQHVGRLCEALNARLDTQIIYCNFSESNDGVYGNYANKTGLSFPYQIRSINLGLMDLAMQVRNLHIADLATLEQTAGRRNIVSAPTYATTGFVYALDVWPDIARAVLDIIQALRGRVHKAIVLDLDNTLWGGIVGDDGLENLQIGDLGIGRVFTDLQAWLKQLKQRGVILAVCSKNYDDVARNVFESHPDMVLRLEDIAVFVANWENKVDNIRHIQAILNVGFDSMVYLDDSSFERRMVKEAIPALTVPDLPEDPADYLETLCSLNLFEVGSLSDTDETRTRQYQQEAQRLKLQHTYESEDAFLASLEMVACARAIDDFHVPRVAQLTQRSNQFNLRTLRYTESEVQRLMNDPGRVSRYFTLQDNVGEYGLVSVVVLCKREDCLFVENWLMSCRVLKRGMEQFVLNILVDLARTSGYRRLVGEYVPTAKNQLVRDHYRRLGFVADGGFWTLDIDTYVERRTHIVLASRECDCRADQSGERRLAEIQNDSLPADRVRPAG